MHIQKKQKQNCECLKLLPKQQSEDKKSIKSENNQFNSIRNKYNLLAKKIIDLGQTQTNLYDEQFNVLLDSAQHQFEEIQVKDIISLLTKNMKRQKDSTKQKKNWSKMDINLLFWVVRRYAQKYRIPLNSFTLKHGCWQITSQIIQNKSPQQCFFKWLEFHKYTIQSHSWTNNQQKILNDLIKTYGQNQWKLISEQLYLQNISQKFKVYRLPKQCKQHWASFLRPDLKKGKWEIKQDLTLLQQIQNIDGQRKWNIISNKLEGRTANAVKNRFNQLITKKKVKGFKNMNDRTLIKIMLKQTAQKCQMNYILQNRQDHQPIIKDQRIKKQNVIKQQNQVNNENQQNVNIVQQNNQHVSTFNQNQYNNLFVWPQNYPIIYPIYSSYPYPGI